MKPIQKSFYLFWKTRSVNTLKITRDGGGVAKKLCHISVRSFSIHPRAGAS